MEEPLNDLYLTNQEILLQPFETETLHLTPEQNSPAHILLIKEETQQLVGNQQDQKIQNVECSKKNKRKRNKKFQNRREGRNNHKKDQQKQLISLENTIQQEHISNLQNLPYIQNPQKEQVVDSQSIQSTSKEILFPSENLTQLSSKSIIGEEQELFSPKYAFINHKQQQVENVNQSSQNELDKTIQNSSKVEIYQKEEVEEEETQNDGLINQKINKGSKPNSVSNSIEESEEKYSFNQNLFDQQHELTPTSAYLENSSIIEQNLHDFYKNSKNCKIFYNEHQSSSKESLFSFNKAYQFQEDKQDNFLDSWKQSSYNQMLFANPFYEPNALNELLQDNSMREEEKTKGWRNDNFQKNEECEDYEDEEVPEWDCVEVKNSDANLYSYNQGCFVYK